MTSTSVAGLSQRLTAQEHREAARRTIAQYMDLCDVPRAVPVDGDLAALFTADAVWEGTGADYSEKFGRVEGRDSIVGMLMAFLPPALHFRTNVHLLGEGKILVAGCCYTGQWIMQQISEYEGGGRELILARINVDFEVEEGTTLISHFRTEKLFVHDLRAQPNMPPLLDVQLKEYR